MPNAISQVRREIKHTGSMKAKIAILLYRLATLYRSRNPFYKLLGIPFVILNKLINECLFCVEPLADADRLRAEAVPSTLHRPQPWYRHR